MKKLLVLLLAVVMTFALVACGGGGSSEEDSESSAPPEEKKELELVGSGYTVTGEGSDLYVYYGVKIKNPTKDYVSEFATIRVTARNEAGEVLDTSDQVLNQIFPGETSGWAGMGPSTQEQPASVDIEIVDSDWLKVASEVPTPLTATISTVSPDEYGYTTVAGEVENPNDETYESVAVVVIFTDANGKITGGDITYADNVAPGGKTPFSLDLLDTKLVTDSYEAFAVIWL